MSLNPQILVGDCRNVLPTLAAGSVQCVVTSPPYFGLRDYGTAQWDGGDPQCDHKISASTLGGGTNKGHNGSFTANYGATCGKCGATRVDSQIGLESTVDAYVSELVAVFREVRRVLADDGTCWINLGDSYAAARGGTHQPAETLGGGKNGYMPDGNRTNRGRGDTYNPTRNAAAIGLKHKDLIGIPWRVAFALQADGWYLRQDIVWNKPNPMPESVRDRCTKAHEYLFLFSKQARYYYDAEAIAEPITSNTAKRIKIPDGWDTNKGSHGSYHKGGRGKNGSKEVRFGGNKYGDSDAEQDRTKSGNAYIPKAKRNKRSVWTISTQGYKGAHFATFPEKLVEPCILAGSRKGDTVLDPFAGSGTTGKVARDHGRGSILIELNPEYVPLIEARINQESKKPRKARPRIPPTGVTQLELDYES